ncbi:MAG TPA: CpsD/CapB family tyrosine-protein kinase [Candidatus Eisenbacteria bacterium]|nr:CpsD/CapB family tyrosine-protein kinase [Candidatus Eisenbacteria bacterium]
MSRIHEALKKAAQERSLQLSTSAEPSFLEVADVPRAAVPLREFDEPALRTPVPTETLAPASYRDLIERCASPKWRIDARMSVFAGGDDSHVGAERFRTLRSRLFQISGTRVLRRVVVTSSVPAEGKTFVAANLAQSIVRQADRKVLLIDADLRASRLHQMLGAPRTPGLADYLSGEADEFKVVQKGSDAHLCFIPAGNEVSNPSELLLNDRMKRLLEAMASIFDWIIIDTPPALPVHDASMMADLCDGVLFVVRAGSTDHEMAAKAAAEFQDKNLLGVVLNRADGDAGYGGYYYSYPAGEESKK